jgi:hypothetical protein
MFPISFTFPWILALLAGLPLLWRILRAAPPPPRTVRFPGVFFLYGLQNREETPGVTPLWLLVLRTVLVTLLVLAAAGPVWHSSAAVQPATRPLVVLLDNSATAVPGWRATLEAAETLIQAALHNGQPVFWAAMAPETDGTTASGHLGSRDWAAVRDTLRPQPWLADVRAVSRLLAAQQWQEPPEIWLVSSGYLPRPFGEGWLAALAENGAAVHVLNPAAAARPRAALTALSWDGGTAQATVIPLSPLTSPLTVELQNRQGEVLATAPATATPETPTAYTARFRLPAEQAAAVRQARIVGENTLAALWLTGGGWGAPPVGLLSAKAASQTRSLLDELHYLRQAVGMTRRTVTGPLEIVLAAGSQVILWPDAVVLNAAERQCLMQFVARGGALVRFAGETLATAKAGDELLPVRLRPGKRALGGSLGETPPRLAAFTEHTPLAGVPIPNDVTVTTQVLPEPVADLPARVWASLSDGTPLVTGKRTGRGWLVLVQTSATPVWSTLVYSGAFPAILGQLTQLGQGGNGAAAGGAALVPWKLLNAEGQLGSPTPGTAALASAENLPAPGPQHPPGLYGAGGRVALNLGPEAAARLAPVEVLWNGRIQTDLQPAQRLAPGLLAAAFMLFLMDLLATLALRGGLRRGAGAAAAVLLMVLAGTGTAHGASRTALDFLAYLPSGDATVDQVTAAGLAGLTQALMTRTAVELAAPRPLRGDAPELPLAPLLYWGMAEDAPTLSAAERDGLRRYLQRGGLLLIDTRSITRPAAQAARLRFIREVLADLGIADVAPVPKDHILSRTFYLLEKFPGRWTAGTLAIPALVDDIADPVAPVIVGSNDYAATWAVNAAGNPLFPALPQGAWQREHALRTGVNIVLYALTGTYKNDQIHLKAILERLE